MAGTMRRRFGAMAVIGGLVLTVAACSSAEPGDPKGGGASGSDAVSVWATSGTDDVLKTSIERWNKDKGANLSIQIFENDPYKSKLRTAISAKQGPTVFSNWGGGGLKTYVDADAVESLQPALDAQPALRDRIFPSVLAGGTVGGKVYGLPCNGVQPVVIYYNKDVLAKAGIKAPTTWDELMADIPKLKAEGVIPFSIGGASKWPYLMWMAYLTDRIGGPEVFDKIVAGEPNAWKDPAVIEAASMIQDLVKAGAFGDSYSSVDANQGAPEALVYTGKAAMQLQGAWAYSGTYYTAAKDFIDAGKLGWATFPAVSGGKGDPSDVTGNLSSFFSVTSTASAAQKKSAEDWLVNGVFDDQYIDQLIESGAVPPISGMDDKIAKSSAPDWNEFIYKTAEAAKNFQLSWDQALDANQSDAVLTNLEKVFLGKITPQQFADNMDKAASQG